MSRDFSVYAQSGLGKHDDFGLRAATVRHGPLVLVPLTLQKKV